MIVKVILASAAAGFVIGIGFTLMGLAVLALCSSAKQETPCRISEPSQAAFEPQSTNQTLT